MHVLTLRRFHLQAASFSLFASIVFSDAALAQDRNDESHGQSPIHPTIGNLVIQSIPAKHYLAGGIETDFKAMGEPVAKTLTEVMEAAKENKLLLPGPVVHYYYGAPHRNPEKRFKMETGFFVPQETTDVGAFKTRELPPFKCATILYVGPATHIGDAWQALYRSVRDEGLTPTDEERELYLYWEGVESPNNIVQVQVGIEQ